MRGVSDDSSEATRPPVGTRAGIRPSMRLHGASPAGAPPARLTAMSIPPHTGRHLPLHPPVASRVALPVDAPSENVFLKTLGHHGQPRLTRGAIRTLQVNVGKRCNMACLHCHVEAGPLRTEAMTRDVAERVIEVVRLHPGIEVVDLTGGAPELNPHFRWLVEAARGLGRRVIDRCNLTVLFEPGSEDLAAFLASHHVEIVASLPCYSAANVEKQRGRGAFDKSIEALRLLNTHGYGEAGSPRRLSLVYNPGGAFLPPAQRGLEAKYKEELARLFGISFHELLTITNMPIRRFAQALEREGQLASYEELLESHFNPETLAGLMCKTTLSVGFDGRLYDCDFNQMLELPIASRAQTIGDIRSLTELDGASIATGRHCFGCTAGAGSSCSGALQ